jgi:hypothetical protein
MPATAAAALRAAARKLAQAREIADGYAGRDMVADPEVSRAISSLIRDAEILVSRAHGAPRGRYPASAATSWSPRHG